jgi:cation-transporting ATPase E
MGVSPAGGLVPTRGAAGLARGLGNSAPVATGRSYREIITENVLTFPNLALFALGTALVLLGHVTDALVSTGVIALNVLVSVLQEVRAKRTLDHVALMTRATATVIRDADEHQVTPVDVVLGDMLAVRAGDQIVVDGRVVGDSYMEVDESLFNGESEFVHKHAGDPVFSGT